jgi:predicted dehydrogenase
MTLSSPVGVGVIGAGLISEQYLTWLAQYPDVKVVTIGDLDTDRAADQASKYQLPRSGDASTVLDDADVEIVINLTIPAAHVEVSAAAIRAGKHVWSEKPIGVDRESSKDLVDLAADRGMLLGVAPDTILGPSWQTAKRAIQAGLIGEPLNAVTSFQWQGPELFHPNPAFLYAVGAGPLFDMGPYYLSALVHLVGPITQVVAVGTRSRDQREIRVGPHAGDAFPIEVPTHVSVSSRFAGGQTASSLMSADSALYRHGVFEINGTEGTVALGDPNYFGGNGFRLYRPWQELRDDWTQTPELVPDEGPLFGRGVGALTMARTLRGNDLHIARGDVGYHVLDTMISIDESINSQKVVDVNSDPGEIRALPADFDPFQSTI